jgi:hypothetical protein
MDIHLPNSVRSEPMRQSRASLIGGLINVPIPGGGSDGNIGACESARVLEPVIVAEKEGYLSLRSH